MIKHTLLRIGRFLNLLTKTNDLDTTNLIIILISIKLLAAPTLDYGVVGGLTSLIGLFGYRHYLKNVRDVNTDNLAKTVITDKEVVDQRLDEHSNKIDELDEKMKAAETHKIVNAQTMPNGQFNVDNVEQDFMRQFNGGR